MTLTGARPATLQERKAFLLALFGPHESYSSSYIQEKTRFALEPSTTPDNLESALDAIRVKEYYKMLARTNAT